MVTRQTGHMLGLLMRATLLLALVSVACDGGPGMGLPTDAQPTPSTERPAATSQPSATASAPAKVETARPVPPVTGPTVTPFGSEQAPSTPILVHLTMPYAPKLDEVVEVSLEIVAYQDAPGTEAEIRVPAGARLVSGNPRWEGDVKAGSPVSLNVTIKFTQEGEYSLSGVALRPVNADMVWGDDDWVYLTVRRDAGFFGSESGSNPQVTTGPVSK